MLTEKSSPLKEISKELISPETVQLFEEVKEEVSEEIHVEEDLHVEEVEEIKEETNHHSTAEGAIFEYY